LSGRMCPVTMQGGLGVHLDTMLRPGTT
jgi:hypothetical protein